MTTAPAAHDPRLTTAPTARDLACVAAQLGRSPHPFRRVVARCPWHAPAVIENLPYDAAGRPFPTLFWATCPALVATVAALESDGGVGRFEALLAADDQLRRSLAAATRYERRRRRDLADSRGVFLNDAFVVTVGSE